MEQPPNPIVEVTLERELDLVIAYKKAMRLAEISGLSFTDQTKFATAVSELSRNAIVHAGKGEVAFHITFEEGRYYIEAVITDQGPGIDKLEELLQKLNSQTNGQRTGIVNCRRLSHKFDMQSDVGKGTCVKIGRRLPVNHPPINRMILSGWRKHFSQLAPVSPYDELKRQNHLLLTTLEELKLKESQATEQLEKIQSLNNELEHNYKKIKELSTEYARQNKLLLKRNEELDEFAHVVSHDLKSPVRNLQALISLFEKGRIKEQEKMVPIFKEQLAKMETLIESILTYSRAGHEEVTKSNINLFELLSNVAETISKPGNFVIEIERDLPVLFTEEIFLYQIYSNLLSNAVKYNDKEEGKIKAGIGHTEDGELFYFVEDNGPGIPLNKRKKVFKMFEVLHKGQDSTGIGLSIVNKIIHERGGRIWVEDAVSWDTGSRFCFTWPSDLLT